MAFRAIFFFPYVASMVAIMTEGCPGRSTTLVCAVFADAGDADPNEIPEEVLNIAQQS